MSEILENNKFYTDDELQAMWSAVCPEFLGLADMTSVDTEEQDLNDWFFGEKIDEKLIVVLGLGKGVRGNMQYILNVLNSDPYFEGYTIYARTSKESQDTVKAYIKQNNWTRTRYVTSNKKYGRLLETAKYLITEVYFPTSYIKKQGQVTINTWHGTPIKKLGLLKNAKNHHKNGLAQKNFIEADYLLYPNAYTREHMLESYKVANLMQGRGFMCGYPRTGGMLEAAESDLSALREQLAPNGEKLYAYMPTFRDYLPVEAVIAQAKELLDYLDAHLRDDQILYVNLHHKVSDSLDYSTFRHIRHFPPTVDSYKLLALTEALISDYSSVFFDYLALRKNIILYTQDYALYKEKRGVYMEMKELPFGMFKTKEAVLEALNRGKTYDDEAAYREFCGYDSADNAKKLCGLMKGETDGVVMYDIPKDDRERVLIFDEDFADNANTKTLIKFADVFNRNKKDIYFCCDRDKTDENREVAYPMLANHSVIGCKDELYLTGLGKRIKSLYLDGSIAFDKAMEYLQYDYYICHKRIWGTAVFSELIIYDVKNPELLLVMALVPAEKTLVLQPDMLALASTDKFLKDALSYALKRCKKAYVHVSAAEKAEELGLMGLCPVQTVNDRYIRRKYMKKKLGLHG